MAKTRKQKDAYGVQMDLKGGGEVQIYIAQFEDDTFRISFTGYGSTRVLKLHLADELDLIVQQSPIAEPGKVY